MSSRGIIGLMAADPHGLIGKGPHLPWSYPEELDHFRQTIRGHGIIMGRRTFDSFPKDLLAYSPAVVFSRNFTSLSPRCTVVESLKAFLAYPLPTDKSWFMIGGAEIAHLFLEHNLLSEFILTPIKKEHEGDVFLDLKKLSSWSIQEQRNFPPYLIQRLSPPPLRKETIHA